jgi:hypothetical protein
VTLDLFAVLLGGATALLPVFARDILFVDGHPVGADGLGLMRAAPASARPRWQSCCRNIRSGTTWA